MPATAPCRPADLEALDHVLEDRIRRDEELDREARRDREVLRENDVLRVRNRDVQDLPRERERTGPEPAALLRGEALDDVGIRGEECRARDARQPVGLRERRRENLLTDGAGREEGALDRPAVGLLPRGRTAQPADGQVPRLGENVPHS